MELPGFVTVTFSGIGVYTPAGDITQGVGLTPDVICTPTPEGLAQGRDELVEKGIELEREKLAFLKKEADQVIDTSRLLTKELRHELENLYRGNDGHSSMFITVLSFGFKYGIPADADLVFDVRFLPNPYYVEELRFHTGTGKSGAGLCDAGRHRGRIPEETE